jgi:hypothetical protein
MEAMELVLERVWSRIGEPVLLGEGNLFGLVVSGVDDEEAESAARRALAAASSLGAQDTRAGVAIYPRDARSAEDLLISAGGRSKPLSRSSHPAPYSSPAETHRISTEPTATGPQDSFQPLRLRLRLSARSLRSAALSLQQIVPERRTRPPLAGFLACRNERPE